MLGISYFQKNYTPVQQKVNSVTFVTAYVPARRHWGDYFN